MKNKLSILALVISVFVTLLACNEEDGGTKNDTSRIQLKLIDAPDEKYEEVNIEIIDIQYIIIFTKTKSKIEYVKIC